MPRNYSTYSKTHSRVNLRCQRFTLHRLILSMKQFSFVMLQYIDYWWSVFKYWSVRLRHNEIIGLGDTIRIKCNDYFPLLRRWGIFRSVFHGVWVFNLTHTMKTQTLFVYLNVCCYCSAAQLEQQAALSDTQDHTAELRDEVDSTLLKPPDTGKKRLG